MPEVREKLFGNGHCDPDGSGSAGSGAVAAAGTPVGRPGIPGTLSASCRAPGPDTSPASAAGTPATITAAATSVTTVMRPAIV